jgi:hypothetical protein
MVLTNIRVPFAGRSSLFRFIEDEKKVCKHRHQALDEQYLGCDAQFGGVDQVRQDVWLKRPSLLICSFFKVVRAWEGTQDHLIQLFSLALQLSYTGSPIYMLLT